MGASRMILSVSAALLLAAGPAAAQGSFNPGGKPRGWGPAAPAPKPRPHETPNGRLPTPPPATKARAPSLAQPPPFKPYEPWKPKSVFGPEGKTGK